jgi:ribosomal protein S9
MASLPSMMLAPRTARHAKLLRLANTLAKAKAPGAPRTETDKLLWVNSHVHRTLDKQLSATEEKLRAKQMPLGVGANNMVSHGNMAGGNLYQFRDFPMFPGEYVPPQHNTLSSLRDELQADLTVQSLKEAWMRVSGGAFFASPQAYYSRADGLDELQLGEIVGALFPAMGTYESRALVRRVLESLSRPDSTPARQLASTVTAESLGLDQAPGHYTNFMEWMGRLMDTKAFATEHSIFQFCRRRFNRKDVRMMWENYNLLSAEALAHDRADSYSHFHSVLKDFSIKVAGRGTRAQIGVRLDKPEVDPVTGAATALGRQDRVEVVCVMKENKNRTGEMFANGKPMAEISLNKSWVMEHVLMPFDEAGLDVRDFDVYFVNQGTIQPMLGGPRFAAACRFAAATALAKLMPLTRIPLKKAGMLSMDRRRSIGEHPGYLNKLQKRRPFYKRG